MKYSELRGQIKSGDVLAWTHRKLKSIYDLKVMAIRFFLMTEYVHVGIAMAEDDGRLYVLEAVIPHVRKVYLSNFIPCYHITGNGLSEKQRELGLSLMTDPDVVYSTWEAIKSAFGWNNPTDKKIQCSEMVNQILMLPCKATPSATVEYMLKSGSSLTEIVP